MLLSYIKSLQVDIATAVQLQNKQTNKQTAETKPQYKQKLNSTNRRRLENGLFG